MKVELSITRNFAAEHSLPSVGAAERHTHPYELECGYAADVDPRVGCTKPLQALSAEVDAVVARLDGQYLNDVLPVTPTAEMLAGWILAHLPDEWEWASIRAYGGYTCTVRRADIRGLFEVK